MLDKSSPAFRMRWHLLLQLTCRETVQARGIQKQERDIPDALTAMLVGKGNRQIASCPKYRNTVSTASVYEQLWLGVCTLHIFGYFHAYGVFVLSLMKQRFLLPSPECWLTAFSFLRLVFDVPVHPRLPKRGTEMFQTESVRNMALGSCIWLWAPVWFRRQGRQKGSLEMSADLGQAWQVQKLPRMFGVVDGHLHGTVLR